MSVELIESELKGLLLSYDWPYRSTSSFVKKWVKGKQAINERFGLNAENNWRLEIPVVYNNESIRETFRGLKYLESLIRESDIKLYNRSLQFDWSKNMIEINDDVKKINMKITKFISSEEISSHVKQYIFSVCSYFDFSMYNGDGTEKDRDSLFRQLVTTIGEYKNLSGKDGLKMVLSTNLIDIMTASSNSSFTSCYRMDGGQCNAGITKYSIDKYSMIAYIYAEDIKYKIGRAMVFIDPESFNRFIIGRRYGNFNSAHNSCLVEFINSNLGLTGTKEIAMFISRHRDMRPTGIGGAGTRGNGYFDTTVLYYHLPNDCYDFKMKFPGSYCFHCGKIKSYRKGGLCKACKNEIIAEKRDEEYRLMMERMVQRAEEINQPTMAIDNGW